MAINSILYYLPWSWQSMNLSAVEPLGWVTSYTCMTNRKVWQNKNVNTIDPNTSPDFSVLCLKWVDIFLSAMLSSQILFDFFDKYCWLLLYLLVCKSWGVVEHLLSKEFGGTMLCLWRIFPGCKENDCLESMDASLDLFIFKYEIFVECLTMKAVTDQN